MKADSVKIAENVYWVGVLDWDLREFHGYTLDGTTYNCYLIFGEDKVALIDNVYPGKSAQFWARIEDAFKKENREFKIDVVIQNHIEKDHLGSLEEVVARFPDVEVYCSKIAISGIKNHLPALADLEFNDVDTGDSLDLGGKTLSFVKAQMLHWPDSMFTMLMEEGILFSNDAFGQHICSSERYADDIDESILKRHAQKYYANLITPSSLLVLKKVKELDELGLTPQVKMIAPCHGQIFKDPSKIIGWYSEWATGKCEDKVTIIYDTMHYSTQTMAHAIAEGIMSENCKVKIYFLHHDNRSDIVTDILDSKAICLGSPTIMNNPYPSLGDTIFYLKALRFNMTALKRKALLFGSKGWAGGATKKLKPDLEEAGFEVCDSYDITYVPSSDVLLNCYELGKKLGQDIKEM